MTDGLTAVFATREQTDLAIEHLVQQIAIDRGAIFAEPIGEDNTAGIAPSGGDAPSGARDADARDDGALEGGIRLTVPVTAGDRAAIEKALEAAGGREIAPA